jgi:peptide/nickel transport system ATP-binding protein
VSAEGLLTVRNLGKTYGRVVALEGVGFTLGRGRTLGVVGTSGSGKSTLARCVAGFETPTTGEIVFDGAAREVQLIVQQPAASLNPRFTAAEIVEEPLVIQRRGTRAERRERAATALALVGIGRGALGKRSQEFSGGERQRLAVARALVLEPKLVILDESFNGLDATLTAQISGLLRELQERLGLSYILIAHDLELVAGLADEIGVMEGGRLAEHGAAEAVMRAPQSPTARELIAATMELRGDMGGGTR